MHFKPQYHTPKKSIDKLDGVNRPDSFIESKPASKGTTARAAKKTDVKQVDAGAGDKMKKA